MTLAPRASVAALELSPFSKNAENEWINIEKEMDGGDCVCVFVGDSLAHLTNGVFPSVMHRPSEQCCLEPLKGVSSSASARELAAVGRISCPFFLRGKRDAIVNGVSVKDIEINANMCRNLWPWKQNQYYKKQTFHKAE